MRSPSTRSTRSFLVAAAVAILAVALAVALVAPPAEAQAAPQHTSGAGTPQWVTGYYTGWYWTWYPPAVVDMTNMTHFVFGRYGPGAGTLGGSPGQFLPGAGGAHDPSVENALITKAHVNGVKAIAMGGGAGDGPGWAASTATPALRTTLIANILDTCVAKDYDGVDIDWEDNLDTPTLQNNLIAFLTQLRTAAAARPRYQPPNAPFLITFPTLSLNTNIDLPVPQWKVDVAARVDQFNIMTYDMRLGCCGWQTWFWAALQDSAASTPMSVESSIAGFLAAGVPISKLGFGLGFYGGGYGPPVTAPRQAIAGYWGGDDNVYNYRDMYESGMLGGPGATYVFDAAAQTGYYRYSPTRTYHGHDVSVLVTEDEGSIAAKGAWSRAGNASGVIIWAINYGYIPGSGTNPPMEAVKQAFLAPVPVELQSFSVE